MVARRLMSRVLILGVVVAAFFIYRAATRDERMVELISRGLGSESAEIRKNAAERLGEMGGTAEAAISELIGMLADDDKRVRRTAAEALSRIGWPAIPELVEALTTHDDVEVRRGAARALSGMGAGVGEDAIAALRDALDDGHARVREGAAMALGRLAPALSDVESIVAELNEALGDDQWQVRFAAVDALGTIGPRASASLDRLKRVAREDPQRLVRDRAAVAVKEVTG